MMDVSGISVVWNFSFRENHVIWSNMMICHHLYPKIYTLDQPGPKTSPKANCYPMVIGSDDLSNNLTFALSSQSLMASMAENAGSASNASASSLVIALWVKSGNRGNLKCLKVNNHFALIRILKVILQGLGASKILIEKLSNIPKQIRKINLFLQISY